MPIPSLGFAAPVEVPVLGGHRSLSQEVETAVAAHALPFVAPPDATLEEIERETIIQTLGRFSGHRQKTAKALGIGVRTLGLKLKKWKELELVSQSLGIAAESGSRTLASGSRLDFAGPMHLRR